MHIRELLAQKNAADIKSIAPDATLLDTASQLRQHNIGALVVTDQYGKLAGVVSERDLVRSIVEFGDELVDQPVSKIMTRKVITCGPDDLIVETLAIMNEKRIRHIPVIENGGLRAMISIREFDHACKQLQAQARTDELTGLANRRYFMEMLDREFSRFGRFKTPFSIAMLDVDHFKHVNDTFGHDAGDKVLVTLANLLVRELRTFDGVGRLGGEEFAVLFPNTPICKAKIACDRLLEAIRAQEVVTDEGAIRFTASFGLTEANPNTRNGHELLKRADKLLYEAKAAGRNRIQVKLAEKPSRSSATLEAAHISSLNTTRMSS